MHTHTHNRRAIILHDPPALQRRLPRKTHHGGEIGVAVCVVCRVREGGQLNSVWHHHQTNVGVEGQEIVVDPVVGVGSVLASAAVHL